MDFISIRIITDDVARLAHFYEQATGVQATWSTPEFAELKTSRATLAIGSTRTVAMFPSGTFTPASNRNVIIEFLVDDVDALYRDLAVGEVVAEPITMPWGNRALLVRDPDGNLVSFFTPVTPEAKARFTR
jgi:predicted enzyme related to lactoylglutathione lyase